MSRTTIKPMISSTPWGLPHVVTELAPGIVRVRTASHGGILLDEDRMAALPKAIAEITTWWGGNAFEEDCDEALVTLAFPDAFDELDCAYAIASVRNDYPWFGLDAFLKDDPVGQEVRRKADDYTGDPRIWGGTPMHNQDRLACVGKRPLASVTGHSVRELVRIRIASWADSSDRTSAIY